VGKIRLALAPMCNHWWNVTLYATSRGLTSSPMPYGSRLVQIDFDFVDHQLHINADDGSRRSVELFARSVADFYYELMARLRSLEIDVSIWPVPVEVQDRIPFDQDQAHAAYNAEHAQRCWRILAQAARVLQVFRSRFTGKASPVHFFWGSFDLAVTCFSGRRAPEHSGSPNVARFVMREAYSHELSACGFWPGAGLGFPAFYAYAYPEPADYQEYPVKPADAYYYPDLREFILPYDTVRNAQSPDEIILSFLQSTYEGAANLGEWDRKSLEWHNQPMAERPVTTRG
jgi:hypothetical protein